MQTLPYPVPGMGYWSKKANKPVSVGPPLPEILDLVGQIGRAETSGTGTVQEPLTVSSRLMSRYDREELYDKVWRLPTRKVAKEYGVSDVALGKTCRKLHIPVAGEGSWNKVAANKSVAPQPTPTPEAADPLTRDTEQVSRFGA